MKAHMGVPHSTVPIVENATYDLLAAADVAIVSSGTATVEAALIDAPMVVVYRVAPFTAWVVRRLARTRHFAMVNLLAGKEIVPELIQDAFTPGRLARETERLLASAEARQAMRGDSPASAKIGAARRHRARREHHCRHDPKLVLEYSKSLYVHGNSPTLFCYPKRCAPLQDPLG